MVFLAHQDLVGAEELLQKNDAGKLVRKGDRAEGQPPVDTLEEAGVETERAADDEAEVPARPAPLFEKARELGGGEGRSLPVEQADKGRVRNSPGRPSLVLDLLDLDPSLSGQQPLVMGHVIGERRTPQAPDADDHDPHGLILTVVRSRADFLRPN
jgi:hypothetical protein